MYLDMETLASYFLFIAIATLILIHHSNRRNGKKRI